MFPNKVVEECNHAATYYFVVKDTAMETKSYMLQFLTVKKKKNHNKKLKPQKHIHTNPQMQLQRCEKALGFSDSLIAETKVRKENMTPTSKQGKVM